MSINTLGQLITSPQSTEERTWLRPSCATSAELRNYRRLSTPTPRLRAPDCQAFSKTVQFCIAVLCFSPPEVESNFPAITYGGRQSASDRQSCETNASPGSVQKSGVLTPHPSKPEQMVCGCWQVCSPDDSLSWY